MDSLLFLLLLLCLGMVAGFFGSFVIGGMTLIGMPAMIFMGLSPPVAVSTMLVGSIAFRCGSFSHYYRANKIVWNLTLPLTLVAFVGSILGAKLVLSIDEALISKLIGLSIVLFIPLLLFNATLGVKERKTSRTTQRIGLYLYFVLAASAAFFAPGAGILLLYLYMMFFGFTILEMRGTDLIPGMVLGIGGTIMFATHGAFHLQYAVALGLGMLAGGFIGSKYAIKVGDAKLRWVVLITALVLAIKLLLGE